MSAVLNMSLDKAVQNEAVDLHDKEPVTKRILLSNRLRHIEEQCYSKNSCNKRKNKAGIARLYICIMARMTAKLDHTGLG